MLALLSDGYRFISKRRRRHRSDVFETRRMLRKAVCVAAEEAAGMFYHPDRSRICGSTWRGYRPDRKAAW
jgi:fatty-acid peroxygenase